MVKEGEGNGNGEGKGHGESPLRRPRDSKIITTSNGRRWRQKMNRNGERDGKVKKNAIAQKTDRNSMKWRQQTDGESNAQLEQRTASE